ncbi:MAG: MATE family efflux transporter [Nitriliruptoraceae bacterium]
MNSRNRTILALGVPATVTLIADPIMGVVDTAVVGRLGPAQLGALGLAVAVLSTVSWIFNFLVFGTTSTVARAVGANDLQAAGRRVAHAAQVAFVIGVVVGAVLYVVAEPLLAMLGAVDELVGPGAEYLKIRAVGIPLLLLGYVGHGAFRGVSDTRTPLGVVVAANIANAALTIWLVFGVGWGLAGAAWATVAAELLTVLAFAVLIGRTRLPLSGHRVVDRVQLRALVVVSRDLFMRTGGLLIGILAITAAAARIGAVPAAAHQILFQYFLLISFLMDGFAIAGQAMVGTALGAGNIQHAREVGRSLLRWGIFGGVTVAVLLLAGMPLIPRLMTDDPAVLAAVGAVWWFMALGQLVNGPVFALDGVLMGAEDFRYLRTWTVIAAVAGGAAGQLVATLGGGLFGLWLAVQLMMAVRLVSLVVRIRSDRWATAGSGLVTER